MIHRLAAIGVGRNQDLRVPPGRRIGGAVA
jgi:hypothetical protein